MAHEKNDMITGINHITLAVSKLELSFQFYTEVLGCRPVARWARGAYLVAGDTWLCLSLGPAAPETPRPEYTHISFSVEAGSFATARQRLMDAGATSWKANRSEGDSFYFLDPDGHKLELHAGDLASRLAACRAGPYEDMVFFDD